MKAFFLIFVGIAVLIIGGGYFWLGLRWFIAAQNIAALSRCIKAAQWRVIVEWIGPRSLWWKFASRNYIYVVGLVARQHLKTSDEQDWLQIVRNDPVLSEHYAGRTIWNDVEIGKYLTNQYTNDVDAISFDRSVVIMIISSMAITVGIVLLIIGTH